MPPVPPVPPVAESNTSSAGPVRAPRASDFLTKGEIMYLFVVPGALRALVVCSLDHCLKWLKNKPALKSSAKIASRMQCTLVPCHAVLKL